MRSWTVLFRGILHDLTPTPSPPPAPASQNIKGLFGSLVATDPEIEIPWNFHGFSMDLQSIHFLDLECLLRRYN